MSANYPSTPRRGRAVLSAAAAIVLAALAALPVAAARPNVTVDRFLRYETVQYFPTSECGPGSTEIATGNGHLVVVDDGTMLHVNYTETFRIRTIWDYNLFPDGERQGTGALTFQITRSGNEIFHESFHDFGPAPFADGSDVKIHLFTTFVAQDGVLRVDHVFGRDLPPEGC